MTNSILTCHALSGCETVARAIWNWKDHGTQYIKERPTSFRQLFKQVLHADLVQQSTGLFTSCYGVKDNISHYYVRSSFLGLVIKDEKKERNLCTKTTVHSANYNYSVSFSHNVKKSILSNIWLSADSTDPPTLL